MIEGVSIGRESLGVGGKTEPIGEYPANLTRNMCQQYLRNWRWGATTSPAALLTLLSI